MKLFAILVALLIGSSPAFAGEEIDLSNYVLEERFTQPQGWKWGSFNDAKGHPIRYGHMSPANPQGLVVFQVGFKRFIEGHFESVRYLVKEKNLAVWYMDWYGNGMSKPDPMSDIPGSEPYDKQAETLNYFFTNIVEKVPNGKNVIVGNSMGGNMVLRYLARYPNTFDLGFLISPMVNVRTFEGSIPESLSNFLLPIFKVFVEAAIAVGKGNEFALFSGGPWKAGLSKEFIYDYIDTSDYKRGVVPMIYQIREPRLRIGNNTYNWSKDAIDSIDFINSDSFYPLVQDKVVFLYGSSDNTRGPSESDVKNFCARLSACSYHLIEGAGHAMWLEADPYRDQLLDYFSQDLEGEIEMQIPSDYSKLVVTWQNSSWAGRNPSGILDPSLINIPFIPKLKVDYGFSDVDGNFIKDKSLIKVSELGVSGINPNRPTEILIDWSKQGSSHNAKIKFDIEENKEILFKELVNRIPVAAIRGAFAFAGDGRYATVDGSVTARIEMFKDKSDTMPVKIEDKTFPIRIHYFLEDDIQITPVQGHENLFFGRIALPSDKGYWLEIKPQGQTLSNLALNNSSYNLKAVGGSSSSDPSVADAVKSLGSLAAFEINGAPNVMKEPTFRCGSSNQQMQGYSGYLAQQMEGGYEAQIPIYIGKEHTKFLTRYGSGYSSYTLIVGGKILVSSNVPSGLYRSTCNIDIVMG